MGPPLGVSASAAVAEENRPTAKSAEITAPLTATQTLETHRIAFCRPTVEPFSTGSYRGNVDLSAIHRMLETEISPMPSQQAIHDLMAQIGPVLDLAKVTEFSEEASWHLAFDADIGMDIEYDPDGERVMITGGIAAEPTNREKVYEALLHYNYLWTEHGGVRAALDGLPGHLVLMLEVPISRLEMSYLCAVLQNFRTVIEGWQVILKDNAIKKETAVLPIHMTGIIRC